MGFLRRCILLIILVNVHSILPRVKIFLKLQSLQIRGNDNLCDPGLISTACDFYLKVCLRETFTENGCELYIVTPRRSFVDQNYIHFENTIGHIENPLSVELLQFPSSPELIIEVHDADFTLFDQDDLIATFRLENFTVNTIPKVPSNEMLNSTAITLDDLPAVIVSQPVRERVKVELTFSIWAQCIPPFYGPRCNSECFPDDSLDHGHYGCNAITGDKVCLPGWHGENCSQTDVCTTKRPCGLMGRCINTNDGFRCVCQSPFKGPFCNVLPNECKPLEETTSMGQNFPFCLNNAFCMFDSDAENDMESDNLKVPLCICRPGFMGTRCERDVDECSLWSGMEVQYLDSNATTFFKFSQNHGVVPCFTPGHVARPCCGPKAQCVNTYGSYQCICPPGWTGSHCEYPPVIWPNGYEPMRNKTDEVPLFERVGFYLGLFSPDAESASESGSHTTVWAYTFIGILVAFLLILLLVIFYLLVLRRSRRKSMEPKYRLPSVRYERQAATYGLPRTSTPASSIQSNMSKSGPYVSHTFRPILPSRPKLIDPPSMEDERTDYEKLCDPPCSQSEDLSTTYDLLEDVGNEQQLTIVHPISEKKMSCQVASDRISNTLNQSQAIATDDQTSTVRSNMLYLEPCTFVQSDDADDLTRLDQNAQSS